jgi:hypothetical protein
MRGHFAGSKTQNISNGKWQRSNGKWFFNLNKWQIANHLNFAVCHLPFEFALFVSALTPHPSGDG